VGGAERGVGAGTERVTTGGRAPAAGVLGAIGARDGDPVAVGALLGKIKEGAGAPSKAAPAAPARPEQKSDTAAPAGAAKEEPPARPQAAPLSPSVRKLATESGMDASTVPGPGKDGRVTKGGLMAAVQPRAR